MTEGSALGKNYSDLLSGSLLLPFPQTLARIWGVHNRIPESKRWSTSKWIFWWPIYSNFLVISSQKTLYESTFSLVDTDMTPLSVPIMCSASGTTYSAVCISGHRSLLFFIRATTTSLRMIFCFEYHGCLQAMIKSPDRKHRWSAELFKSNFFENNLPSMNS
jgi:hypothetical protein